VTLDAINIALADEINLPLHDRQALEGIARRFKERWGANYAGCYDGCIGDIDGLIIRVRKPSRKETSCGQAFFCGRYKCFGLAYQVICDADCIVMWYNGNHAGSVHDSTAFKNSSLYRSIREVADTVLKDLHIAGDGAYADEEWLLTPWPEPRLGVLAADKDTFNYVHSLHRQPIERTFGLLVGRWLVLERDLRVPLRKVDCVVAACMRLNNVCIRRKQGIMWDDGKRVMGESGGGQAHSASELQGAAS